MAKKENMQKTMAAKTDQELTALLGGTRKELRELRFSAAGARPKDPSAAKKLRKVVARVLTAQHSRAH